MSYEVVGADACCTPCALASACGPRLPSVVTWAFAAAALVALVASHNRRRTNPRDHMVYADALGAQLDWGPMSAPAAKARATIARKGGARNVRIVKLGKARVDELDAGRIQRDAERVVDGLER